MTPTRGAARVGTPGGRSEHHQDDDDGLQCTNWYTSGKARRPGAGKPAGPVAEFIDGREAVLGGAYEYRVEYRRFGWVHSRTKVYASRTAAERFIYEKVCADNRPDLAAVEFCELRRRPVARTWEHDTTYTMGGVRWH